MAIIGSTNNYMFKGIPLSPTIYHCFHFHGLVVLLQNTNIKVALEKNDANQDWDIRLKICRLILKFIGYFLGEMVRFYIG